MIMKKCHFLGRSGFGFEKGDLHFDVDFTFPKDFFPTMFVFLDFDLLASIFYVSY